MPQTTETAVANGDTRTLHLYHTHTHESIDATFRVNGHYDPQVLKQLNHFLRDWRNNDEINMDPRLFDTLWEVYRTAGATQPIQIYSAYRSPETNAMLRRRSRAVAEHSQHMLGKAMDTTIPGFPMHLIREVGMKLQHGGVGWYPSANFVHLDVGSVRSWPRMPYDQLAALFPDGKTVHVASNGQVLPGYEAARAEIMSRGIAEAPPAQESQGFFAWLFGNSSASHEDDEDRRAVASAAPVAAPAAPAPVAQSPAAPAPSQMLAYAEPSTQDDIRGATETQPHLQPNSAASPIVAPVGADKADNALPMPLPPRRPFNLAINEAVPLPPSRPEFRPHLSPASLKLADAGPSRRDAIGELLAARSSQLALRKSMLPAIITQDSGRLPPQTLAYAEPVAPEPLATRQTKPASRGLSIRTIGLRAALTGTQKSSRPAPSQGSAPADLLASPRMTGLRKAAHQMEQRASL